MQCIHKVAYRLLQRPVFNSNIKGNVRRIACAFIFTGNVPMPALTGFQWIQTSASKLYLFAIQYLMDLVPNPESSVEIVSQAAIF